MNPDLLFGLQISITGLAVTFLALGLLIFVIRLLLLIFPGSEIVEVKSRMQPQPSQELIGEQQREETAVALAVAVALLEREQAQPERDPALGKLLEPKE